jgi:DNA-binding IclR family transcriptional regulator
LDSALDLLSEFMGSEPDFGVAELAERTGMPKSQVSKILATFRAHQILEQDPRTRRYYVGPRTFALGSRFLNHDPLVRAAMPVLRNLVDQSGHSSRLSIRVGDEVLYLIGLEGPHFVETGWRAGQWMPMHAASAARVLLAFFPPQKIQEVLDTTKMAALTPETLTDRAKLMSMLSEIQQTGVARNRNETAVGLSTLSVPILGRDSDPIAALTLAFPSNIVHAEAEAPLVDMLRAGAQAISYKMGCAVYRFPAEDERSGKRTWA